MSSVQKCLLETKVLRLLLIFGGLSTATILFTLYYLTSANYDAIGQPNIPSMVVHTSPSHDTISSPKKHAPVAVEKYHEGNLRSRFIREKIMQLTSNNVKSGTSQLNISETARFLTGNVHIFYSIPVNWYQINSSRSDTSEMRQLDSMQIKQHQPNIVFYPLLGLYKIDSKIITHHLENIRKLGTTVLIVTWSPQFQHSLLIYLLNELHKHKLQLAVEIDDYPNRTVHSIFNDLDYFYREIWWHEAFYKVYVTKKRKYMPMFYVKNVGMLPAIEWSELLSLNGVISLRRSLHDAIFIGHISSKRQVSLIKTTNFDGFYSRTPSNGATYTSTWKNWAPLKKSADEFKLIFIPTVGPGYNENKKPPKTGSTRRHRTNGHYFGVAWRSAMGIRSQFVSIASYNDWPAGTQIEEAISKNGCKDYSPGTPTKYLDLTRHYIGEFIRTRITTEVAANCHEYLNNTIC